MWKAQIPNNWQAARDFLARRFPKRWGAKEKIDHTGSVTTPTKVYVVGAGEENPMDAV
jgi:hypothetical protein